jgi:hypothetical protein
MASRCFRPFAFAAACAALFSFTACKKTEPAEALVYVVDSLGAAVPAARVVLRNDSVTSPTTGAQAIVYQEGVTDGAGQAYFIFEHEAVLFVEVTKGALFERDYIRLEQSKQVDKTVVLK